MNTRKQLVWAIAFENALRENCNMVGDERSFAHPTAIAAAFARKWADAAVAALRFTSEEEEEEE